MFGPLARLAAWIVNGLRIMLMAKFGVIIAKILLYFGLSIVVHKFAIAPAIDQIQSLISAGPGGGLAGTVLAWAGVMKFDVALSMVLSAYAAAATIKSGRAALGIAQQA